MQNKPPEHSATNHSASLQSTIVIEGILLTLCGIPAALSGLISLAFTNFGDQKGSMTGGIIILLIAANCVIQGVTVICLRHKLATRAAHYALLGILQLPAFYILFTHFGLSHLFASAGYITAIVSAAVSVLCCITLWVLIILPTSDNEGNGSLR